MAGCYILCLLVIIWTLVAVSVCYDVTTIYRFDRTEGADHDDVVFNRLRGSVEIHARTDALGLPFMSPNSSVISPGIGVDVPECTALDKGCDWKLDSWSLEGEDCSNSSSGRPLRLKSGDFNGCGGDVIEGDDISVSRPLESNGKLLFNIKFDSDDHASLFLLLLEDRRQKGLSIRYYIRIYPHNYYTRLFKCDPTGDLEDSHEYESEDLPYYGSTPCVALMEVDFRQKIVYWRSNEWYNFTLEIKDNQLDMSMDYLIHRNPFNWGEEEHILDHHDMFHWEEAEPILVKHYRFHVSDARSDVKFLLPDGVQPALSLTAEVGTLTSPVFLPTSGRVCVVITYLRSPGPGNTLQVQAQSAGQKLMSAPTAARESWGRWRTQRFITDIPLEDRHKPMQVLVTATKSESSEVLIQRISGCNAEDGEDIAVISADGPMPLEYTIYDVAVNERQEPAWRSLWKPASALECENGGVYDGKQNKCSCPVGFIGRLCAIGCGPNSYGDDCGGMCSKSVTGCRGMLLCRPGLNCTCAPGVRGPNCDNSCEAGNYGAGCNQICGSCIGSGPCDPYTGACVGGCQSGYFPPLCKNTYKFPSTGPDVKANGFHELSAIDIQTEDTRGQGTPRFAQLQYKEKLSRRWLELDPLLLSSDLAVPTINITGLRSGVTYHVRTVLIDKDGSSYQGETVPYTEIQTRCTVPNSAEYHLSATHVTDNSFHIEWSYFPEPTRCSLLHFELHLKEGWRWFVHSKSLKLNSHVTHKLAGSEYPLKVRAVTSNGPANFSPVLKVYTRDQTPAAVVDLQVVSEKSSELQLSWDAPRFTAGIIRRYHVTYQCVSLLACAGNECSESVSWTDVSTNSIVLRGLLAHAQYNISVAACASSMGPAMSVLAATDYTVPSTGPSESNVTVSGRSNTSFTVHWSDLHSCRGQNGFLQGYRYELSLAGERQQTVLLEGTTKDLHVTFTDLKPHSEYQTRVYLVSSGGWSTQHPLVIGAKTKPTVPDTVEHLTVYKRSRRMLGLRWAPPAVSYGLLESFTVTYRMSGDANSVSSTVRPTPCVAWPHLFCHTILLLRSDTNYIVTVQARNSEVNEDGEPATIMAVTLESTPGPPKNLRLVNRTSSSLAVEWQLPNMLNGVLWSFLINLQEIDSFNSTACCQRFPLHEISVDEERPAYNYQFTGLQPASRYSIIVSGKTAFLGPATSISASTRPPVLEMVVAPQVDLQIQPNEPLPVTVQPSTVFRELVSGYLLLVLPHHADPETPDAVLWDKDLEQELKDALNRPFYIAAEFHQADLEENPVTRVGTGKPMVEGAFGQVNDPALTSGGTYEVAQVAILDYSGARNFGYILSDSFTIP